jgi:6-phosphogluconolactonase/glucosamine-6-phosphate isomerase/deaminase
MRINQFSSQDEAKKGLAARVSSELTVFQENSIPVLFLFSGGSALSILDIIDPECLDENLTVAPIDERHDPTGRDSNFAALLKTDFYKRAETAGSRFIDTRVKPGQGRDELANEFENALRKWVSEKSLASSIIALPPRRERQSRVHGSGKIIAILGVGPDGHTAGIFPDNDEKIFRDRFEGDRWVVGYRGPEYATCPERVTVTLASLENYVDQSFVFLSGEKKRAAWECIIKNDEPVHLLPAGIFYKLRKMEIFTDLR